MEAQRQGLMISVGLLILRLGMGGYMLTHGWGKTQSLYAGDFEMFAGPMGLGGVPTLVLLVLSEFLCALLVMAGLGTRVAAVPVVITMAVAAFWAHGADPWTAEAAYYLYMDGEAEHWFSKQPALMFLIPFLALIFTGAGKLSIDALVWRRIRTPRTRERRCIDGDG